MLSVGIIIVTAVILIAFLLNHTLKNKDNIWQSSMCIINQFEPDNTAPKLTELVDFHKKDNNPQKYKID